jgi:hypothetical protein
VREAGNQPGVQRINSVRMHDGNGLAGVHKGKCRGRRYHDDDDDIQPNHLSRKVLEKLSPASCIPALDDQVAALLVPVLTESLEQGVVKAFMSVGDKSHSPNFVCVLRKRTKRQSSYPAAHKGYEIAPSHVRPPMRPICRPTKIYQSLWSRRVNSLSIMGWDVRFTPNSGHRLTLFDHSVGAIEQRARHAQSTEA